MKKLNFLVLLLFVGIQGFSQSFISKQNAIADLDFYNKNLLEIHVNPFQFVEKQVYYAEVEKIKKNLNDSVQLRDFISELSRLSALMEDSHSSPGFQQPGLAEEAKNKQFFPFRTVLENDRLFVAKDSSLAAGITAGTELIAINGKEVKSLIRKFRRNIGGIAGYKNEMLNRLFFHYLFMEGVQAPFLVNYIEPSGNESSIIVQEGITHLQGLLSAFPAFSEGNSYEVLEGKVGYIKFNSMYGNVEEWMDLLEKAFTEFEEKNVKVVAVDIRDNTGGNSLFGNVLFGFITSKEFQLQGKRQWKVSQQYKDYLTENGNDGGGYLEKEIGSIWNKGSCKDTAVSLVNAEQFDGEVYLLTGPFTFSSGMMVADAARQYQLANLVGEPTGENTTDFGEVLSITLPNTGIVMNLATSMDIGADCNPNNFSPVIPDVPVTTSLQDKIEGNDKVLEYMLNRAREDEGLLGR